MISDVLKKYSQGNELMKQEGTFSLLLGYGFCAHCLFGPKWYELYNQDYNFFLGVFDINNGIFIFDWGKYKETTDIEYRNMSNEGDLYHLRVLPLFAEHSNQVAELYQKNNLETIAQLDNLKLRQLIFQANELASIVLRDSLFSEAFDEDMARNYYLQAGGKAEDFQKFFAITSALTFDSFKIRRDKIIWEQNKKDGLDYYELQWIYTNYFSDKPLSEVESTIKQLDFDKIAEEIKANDQQIEKNKLNKEQYLQTLSPNLKALAYFIGMTMRIRDERNDPFAQALTIIYNSAYEYFKRLGFNPQDCIYSFYTDYLNNILENDDYPQLIEDRKKGCAVIAETGQPVKYTWEFKDYQQIRQEFLDIVEASVKKDNFEGQLKGQVSNPGKVKGKVKIVLSSADFAKFNQGDILVASMTRPDYVPVMKKAKAIITDEGGITCHAAIVSRELNIPCVIGTKNATRVLQDGDMVEVDANQGIIKIIK